MSKNEFFDGCAPVEEQSDDVPINTLMNNIIAATNYNATIAMTKLYEHNMSADEVIAEYIKKNRGEIKSINSEIYSQIRAGMNNVMRDYNERNPTDVETTIVNVVNSIAEEEDGEK